MVWVHCLPSPLPHPWPWSIIPSPPPPPRCWLECLVEQISEHACSTLPLYVRTSSAAPVSPMQCTQINVLSIVFLPPLSPQRLLLEWLVEQISERACSSLPLYVHTSSPAPVPVDSVLVCLLSCAVQDGSGCFVASPSVWPVCWQRNWGLQCWVSVLSTKSLPLAT